MRSQIASGAGWMVLFKLVDRGLGLVSTVILARLLVPHDFGIVAMAMSVIAIIELATWLSFDLAIIQRHDVGRVHFDTAWTLNILLALACGTTIALLAYPAAVFYEKPQLTSLMLLLAIGYAIGGLENIGIVNFRRNLDFSREFRFMLARRTFTFFLTTTLAFVLQNYWALVIGTVAGKVAGVFLSYVMHPYRPRFSLAAARELVRFSKWVVGTNILNAVQGQVPNFVVGRMLGASSLGVITIGTEIAQLPSSDLIAPINRAVFPGYSRMAQDTVVLRALFLDVIGVIVLVAVPAAVGIAAVADPLVRTMLGEKWLEAIPVIQVLAVSAAIGAVTSNNSTAYLAIGRPGLITFLATVRLALLVPLALLLTQRMGLLGAAVAQLVSSMLLLSLSLPILFSKLQLKYSGYFSRIWRPIAASAVMAYCVTEVIGRIPAGSVSDSALAFATGIAVGLLTYPLTIFGLWILSGRPPGAEAILQGRLKGIFRNRTSSV